MNILAIFKVKTAQIYNGLGQGRPKRDKVQSDKDQYSFLLCIFFHMTLYINEKRAHFLNMTLLNII